MASNFKGNPSVFSLLGLREVIPDQTGAEQWKELTLNTGGTHLTLEDVKLPEGCTSGGFCYRDSLSPLTRNRFITWKVVSDVLELVEHSLDLDLSGNHLRVRFQGLAILEGTSIHETKGNVVILVSTISAVHRLVLPHPSRHSELGSSPTVPSIFTETSQAWLRDSSSHQVVSSSTTNISLPCIAASCVTPGSLGAVFAVANQSSISCIRLGSSVSSHTLQPSSNLTRLLSGYLPNVLRSSSTSENEDTTASLSLLPTKSDDILVAALSKGLKLRIWSSATQECKLDCDLTEYFGDKTVKQLGSQHRMRYVRDSETGNFCIAVFSSFGKNRSFLLLNLQVNSNFKINFVSSVTALHSRLIDFSLTSNHIYALWSTSKGDFLLEFMEIPCKKQEWQSVTLEPGIGAEVEYDESITDPKEAYLEAIFKPGSFSISTLSRALQAFNRSGRKTSSATIKEDIIAAIESELMDQSEQDLSEEEWLQLSCKCWAQFYAYLVQYHSKRRIPLGLLVDESTGLHAVLKMGMFSLLRPLDVVESLVLQKGRRWDETPFSQLLHHPQSGIVALLEVLSMVNDALTVDQVKSFQQSMFQLDSADQIAAGIADELIQSESSLNLLNSMQMALSSVDICTALSALIQQLNVNGSSSRIEVPVVELDKEGKNSFRLLFNGSLGLGALAESSRQMADLRLALCRNVLIVQQLLILARKKLQLSPDDAETIRSEFLPRTVPLTHACYALSWLCNHPAQVISNPLMEQNIRTMALLGFKKPQESFQNSLRKSLVELYLSLDGGNAVRNIVMQEENVSDWSSPWLDVFPDFMKAIGQLLWPIGNHTSFMEFLMERFQPSAIQGYIRLQQNWCEWNTCSRKFLMAVALVATGEGVKASRWMLEAAEGIAKEDLLLSIVTRESDQTGGHPAVEADLAMRFHLTCVQLLEQAALPSAALKVALAALNSGRTEDPLIPTMWSIVAKLHLLLGHYQEAYEAIVSNPDGSQRPEILGRLVNTLLERKRMDTLLTFPYAGLESELEKIVERRARSSDVLSMKVYYSFLYAFHVRQGKMRKAAAVMHEQALRHGCEGESALRVKCLLACLNSLRLVPREEAWLVKPVEGSSGSKGSSTQQRGRTVDVIEYDDIEKEYELSYACLNLGQSADSLTPADVVALLTCRNRYESALRIARIFNVKETALIVEHLAANCVALSRDHGDEEEAWVWLAENRCSGVGKASEQAWRLLEKLLPKAEGSGDNKLTRCHKAASRKILSLDCTLPYWLTASYKLRNPGELISVFHQSGLLEDAAQVALEMFDAVLGKGKEYFGFSNPSEVNAPPIWLPYNVLDRLLLELNAHSEDPLYRKMLDDLQGKMDDYFQIAERNSRSIVESSMS